MLKFSSNMRILDPSIPKNEATVSVSETMVLIH